MNSLKQVIQVINWRDKRFYLLVLSRDRVKGEHT